MPLPDILTLNGTEISTAALSEPARQQVTNIQAVDAEITRLQQQLAIAQTAVLDKGDGTISFAGLG